MSIETWVDWSSWLFGFRIDWRQEYWRFVVIELGPFALCLQYDPATVSQTDDTPTTEEALPGRQWMIDQDSTNGD